MKKPMYSVDEINALLQDIECDKSATFNSIVKESLSNFVLCEGSIDVCKSITSEVYNLEQEAKYLRSIIRAFKGPIKEMPTLMNDKTIISHISKWRMKIGR